MSSLQNAHFNVVIKELSSSWDRGEVQYNPLESEVLYPMNGFLFQVSAACNKGTVDV
jgi:hypothetical protein